MAGLGGLVVVVEGIGALLALVFEFWLIVNVKGKEAVSIAVGSALPQLCADKRLSRLYHSLS